MGRGERKGERRGRDVVEYSMIKFLQSGKCTCTNEASTYDCNVYIYILHHE